MCQEWNSYPRSSKATNYQTPCGSVPMKVCIACLEALSLLVGLLFLDRQQAGVSHHICDDWTSYNKAHCVRIPGADSCCENCLHRCACCTTSHGIACNARAAHQQLTWCNGSCLPCTCTFLTHRHSTRHVLMQLAFCWACRASG